MKLSYLVFVESIFFFAYALPDFNIEYVNGEYEEDEYNQVLVDID